MTERDARIGRAVGWTAALLFGVAVGGYFGYHSSAGREQGGTIGLLTEAAGGFLMVGFVAVVLVIGALASRSEDSRDLGPASLLVALATVIGFPVVPFVVEHLEWGYAAPLFRTAHALATVRLTGTDAFTGEATLSGTCTAPGKTGAVAMVEISGYGSRRGGTLLVQLAPPASAGRGQIDILILDLGEEKRPRWTGRGSYQVAEGGSLGSATFEQIRLDDIWQIDPRWPVALTGSVSWTCRGWAW